MSEEIAMIAANGTISPLPWRMPQSRRGAAEWNPVALERAAACLKIAAIVALQGGALAFLAFAEVTPPRAPALDLSVGISAVGIGALLACAGRMLERLSLRSSIALGDG